MIAYDAMMSTRTITEVAQGGFHDVSVPLPALLMAVIAAASDRFQIAHNHPSGDVRPSDEDVALTRRVVDAANTLGLYFEDHLIVGPSGDVWSFVDEGMLIPATVQGHTMESTRRPITAGADRSCGVVKGTNQAAWLDSALAGADIGRDDFLLLNWTNEPIVAAR